MKLSNVNLIFLREVRDQFRDRRTLFMIFVLPMLLYPLLAMSMTQVAQFVREHPTPIKIIGLPELEGLPALVNDGHVAKEWLGSLRPDLLPVELESVGNQVQDKPIEQIESEAQAAIKGQGHQAVLYFPPSFAHELERFRQAVVTDRQRSGQVEKPPNVPEPRLFVNSADEKSKMAGERVSRAVTRWTDAIGERILASGDLPVMAAHPFELKEMDVADVEHRKAAVWSKMLPFVLIIWALTGAFYPAIDLCAGEKERGTLETLLTSPAERSEIVTGKLLTVMLFSMATSALNLVSMGVTGLFMFQQFQALGEGFEVGLPPLRAGLWLLLTLIPVSALFSALCLALASFAQQQGRPVLPCPRDARLLAAVDPADVAGRGTLAGLQPDPAYGSGVVAEVSVGGGLSRGVAVRAAGAHRHGIVLCVGAALGDRPIQQRERSVP